MVCVLTDADISRTFSAPLPWHYKRTSIGEVWGGNEKKKIENHKIIIAVITVAHRLINHLMLLIKSFIFNF